MSIPIFESVLIGMGILPAIAHETRHLLDGELDDHFANSLEVYHPSERNRVVQNVAPRHGGQFGSGRVKLTLANMVELVLDDVLYDPLRRYQIKPFKPRVNISLRKLLANSGTTLEVEGNGHWHVRKDGQLLVFGINSDQDRYLKDRVALGPPLSSILGIASPQSLQGAITAEPADNAVRPRRNPSTTIVRSTIHEVEKSRRIPGDPNRATAIAATEATPTAVHSIGASSGLRVAGPQELASVPLNSRSGISSGTRATAGDRKPPASFQNIGGMWVSSSEAQSAIPAAGASRSAVRKPQEIPLKTTVSGATPNPKSDARAHSVNAMQKGNPRAENEAYPARKGPFAETPRAAQRPAARKSVVRKSVVRKSVTRRKPSTKVEIATNQPSKEKSRCSGTTPQGPFREGPGKEGNKTAKTQQNPFTHISGEADAVPATTATNPAKQVQGSLGKRCSTPEKTAAIAGQNKSRKGDGARDAKDAARNHWSKLSCDDFPRAGKDTR